jgi:hypothetical protein
MFLVGLVQVISAQTNHYNANWVFGHQAGIKFHGNDSTSLFRSKSHSLELASSISDKNKELLYYIGKRSSTQNLSDIFTKEDSLLKNGKNLFTNDTYSEGINLIKKKNKFYVFYSYDSFNDSCKASSCRRLYYSVIQIKPNNTYNIIKKTNLYPMKL